MPVFYYLNYKNGSKHTFLLGIVDFAAREKLLVVEKEVLLK